MADYRQEIWRIFSRPDGTSTMEKTFITLKGEEGRAGWAGPFIKGKGFSVKRMQPGRDVKWHTPSKRQIAVTISGMGEIETEDGQKLIVKPGVMNLMEDFAGKGHLTRVLGNEDRVVVFVSVDDDVKVG